MVRLSCLEGDSDRDARPAEAPLDLRVRARNIADLFQSMFGEGAVAAIEDGLKIGRISPEDQEEHELAIRILKDQT